MRVLLVIRGLRMLCGVAVVGVLAIANAGPRRTLEAVTLRKKPGEKEAVVARLPANTPITVLALEGRWLLVRANSVAGYVTRTTISAPEPPEPGDAAPSGRWSAARQVDGRIAAELYVQVVAPGAVLRAAPDAEAAPVVELGRGHRLTVVDAARVPAWIHARDQAGHDGWIARRQIDNGASGVAITPASTGGELPSGEPQGERRAAVPTSALAVRADLGIGFRTLGMDLTSNADGGLANYALDADAVAAVLDVDVARRIGSVAFVAADLRLSASDSSPGIDYPGPTAPAGRIAFRTVASDVGVRVGVRARRAFDLALRAGGHYDAFVATDVNNAGRLPRERLTGLVLGARVDIAPARSRFTITARFDVLAVGSRAQTSGLEDGTASTARALWGGLTLRYPLLHRVGVFGGYDASRASTEWSGMSVRQSGVTRTRRIDTAQLVQIGVTAEL